MRFLGGVGGVTIATWHDQFEFNFIVFSMTTTTKQMSQPNRFSTERIGTYLSNFRFFVLCHPNRAESFDLKPRRIGLRHGKADF